MLSIPSLTLFLAVEHIDLGPDPLAPDVPDGEPQPLARVLPLPHLLVQQEQVVAGEEVVAGVEAAALAALGRRLQDVGELLTSPGTVGIELCLN